jgi:hypothetical protein
MSVGFGSDVDENEEIQLNLSELQLSEIRLAFTEVSLQTRQCSMFLNFQVTDLSRFLPSRWNLGKQLVTSPRSF